MNNKQILEKANSAISKGRYEEFLSFCTEDTVWNFIGDQTLEGKDAVRKYMEQTYIEPPTFDVEKLVAEDDFVIAIGTIWIKDENNEVNAYEYCDVWRFLDGKMSALKAFVSKIEK